MDNQRIILFFALSIVLLLIWQSWQADYGTPAPATVEQAADNDTGLPAIPDNVVAEAAGDRPALPDAAANVVPTDVVREDSLSRGKRIRVVTDVLDIDIDVNGGDIRRADLITYPVSADRKDKPFRLMQDKGLRVLIAQSGLLSKSGGPDHYAQYRAEKDEYRMQPGSDSLTIPLRWEDGKGLSVIKTYTFHRDSFLIEVRHSVENDTASEWRGHQYRQLQRTEPGDDEGSAFIYTYTGGVIYSDEEKYEKYDFDDMRDEDLKRDIDKGWAAMIQHYFLTAWIPDQDETNSYYSKAPEGRPYVLGLVSPEKSIQPGERDSFVSRLYIGPKDQERIEGIATGLKLTVDYGILTFLAQPLFWLLTWIFKVLGNWGFAIIVLTLMIKLVFYKLSEKSYRSMANMRRMTPKITQIRERYGDDRQRMSQAMMELYKKEKINPLGGCLPILVQIPVFIALYWVLLESVELRQAPFVGWIHDLSVKDPYYILPVLMGITMFIQQKLNPPPPDPIQAKVLMALPFIFTAFFAFFPSGLVLYWVANSGLSIAQQWVITRRIEKAAEKA